MYKVIYKFNISPLFITEQEYNTIVKKHFRFIDSLPDFVGGENDFSDSSVPKFTGDLDTKYIVSFVLYFRDIDFLQEGLRLLESYCTLYYNEPDPCPEISNV